MSTLDAFINLIPENSLYFWNIILILVTLHRPCPVCSLKDLWNMVSHQFWIIKLDYFVLTDPRLADQFYCQYLILPQFGVVLY